MSSWTHREVEITRYEWLIPKGHLGACWSEVNNALGAALREYRKAGSPDGIVSDDAVRFTSDDDNIVIFFERENGKLLPF